MLIFQLSEFLHIFAIKKYEFLEEGHLQVKVRAFKVKSSFRNSCVSHLLLYHILVQIWYVQ